MRPEGRPSTGSCKPCAFTQPHGKALLAFAFCPPARERQIIGARDSGLHHPPDLFKGSRPILSVNAFMVPVKFLIILSREYAVVKAGFRKITLISFLPKMFGFYSRFTIMTLPRLEPSER